MTTPSPPTHETDGVNDADVDDPEVGSRERRVHLLLAWCLGLVVWPNFGRAFMGERSGWTAVANLLLLTPILLVGLGASVGIITARPAIPGARPLLPLDVVSFTLLSLTVVGYTVFIVDADDQEDFPSVAQRVFDVDWSTTYDLGTLFVALSGIALLLLAVEALATFAVACFVGRTAAAISGNLRE